MRTKVLGIERAEDLSLLDNWPKTKNTFAICFGNDAELMEAAFQRHPDMNWIGASAAGQIRGREKVGSGISIELFELEESYVKTSAVTFNSREEGETIAEQLYSELKSPDLKSILIFSEGLVIDATDVTNKLQEIKAASISIGGGVAGDPLLYERTYVLEKSIGVHEKAVVALGIYGGKTQVKVFSHSGVTPFGIEREVTKSEVGIIYELDGKPAAQVYAEYIGKDISELKQYLITYPFAITDNYIEEGVVRTPTRVSDDGQGIIFTGHIPEGKKVRLMQSATSKFIDGVYDLIDHVKEIQTSQPKAAIAISCACRMAVLGTEVDEEPETICSELGVEDIVGFYSFGEIGSDLEDNCHLYNQTLTLVLFYEE